MMEAQLGVITCDKCDEAMEKGQPILVIAEGKIIGSSEDELRFCGFRVRYACHLSCWDGIEDICSQKSVHLCKEC